MSTVSASPTTSAAGAALAHFEAAKVLRMREREEEQRAQNGHREKIHQMLYQSLADQTEVKPE